MAKRVLCNAGVSSSRSWRRWDPRVAWGTEAGVAEAGMPSTSSVLIPVPSSRDHLQVPRAFPLGWYRPIPRASLELPLCAVDVGGPVTTEC